MKKIFAKKKVKKISKNFLQKFFSPNLTQIRNAPLSRRNHEKFEKKNIFIKKHAIPDHQIFNRWSKKIFDKKFDAVWVPKNSISIIKLQKK